MTALSSSLPTDPAPAPSSSSENIFAPDAPALLIVEGWPATREIFPEMAKRALPGVKILTASNLDEARAILTTHGPRIRGFVTNGCVHGGKTPHDTLALVDEMLGRKVPFVLLTGMTDPPKPEEFARPPLEIVLKPMDMWRCLMLFRPHIPECHEA